MWSHLGSFQIWLFCWHVCVFCHISGFFCSLQDCFDLSVLVIHWSWCHWGSFGCVMWSHDCPSARLIQDDYWKSTVHVVDSEPCFGLLFTLSASFVSEQYFRAVFLGFTSVSCCSEACSSRLWWPSHSSQSFRLLECVHVPLWRLPRSQAKLLLKRESVSITAEIISSTDGGIRRWCFSPCLHHLCANNDVHI